MHRFPLGLTCMHYSWKKWIHYYYTSILQSYFGKNGPFTKWESWSCRALTSPFLGLCGGSWLVECDFFEKDIAIQRQKGCSHKAHNLSTKRHWIVRNLLCHNVWVIHNDIHKDGIRLKTSDRFNKVCIIIENIKSVPGREDVWILTPPLSVPFTVYVETATRLRIHISVAAKNELNTSCGAKVH